MKWEKSKDKLTTDNINCHSENKKTNQNQSKRQRIEASQFNRISRESLRKSFQKERNFNSKDNLVIFNSLPKTDSKKIAFNTQTHQLEHHPSLSLFPTNPNTKYNNQMLSVKSKENSKNNDSKTKIKAEGYSPDRDTVIPTIAESNSNCKKSLNSPFGNTNIFTADNQYTPPKYFHNKLINFNSSLSLKSPENKNFIPERLPIDKCRNLSLSQLKLNTSSLIHISPFKDIASEKLYQIKKYRHLRNYRFSTNPTVREQAGKIIQLWWKKIKSVLSLLIKIQSNWRGYRFKKQLYGIISVTLYYQTFCIKLYKVMKGYTRRSYFSLLHLRRQRLLLKLMKLKLKQYYLKWEKKTRRALLVHKIAIRFFLLRNRNYNAIKSLRAYFQIWDINIQYKLILERKDKELLNQKHKYASLNILLMGLNTLVSRKCLKKIGPGLNIFLRETEKKRSIKLMLRKRKQINLIVLKETFYKWKTNNVRYLYLTLFENMKTKSLSNLIKQKHRSDFKCSFDFFKKGLIEELTYKIKLINTKVIIPTAIKHICMFSKIKAFQSFRKSIKNNKYVKIIKHNLQKQIKRHYLNSYSEIVKTITNEEKLKKLTLKHFIRSFRLDKSTNQLKYFYKWKLINHIQETKYRFCRNYGVLVKTLNHYITKKITKTKEFFYRSIDKTVHNNAKAKVLVYIIGNNSRYVLRNKYNLLNYWFYHWKQNTTNYRIRDIRGKLTYNFAKHQINKMIKKLLSKGFNHWRTITILVIKSNKNVNITKGLLSLDCFEQMKMKSAMSLLMKPKFNYSRGKMLLSLSNMLSHSIIQRRLYFTKWRLIQIKETLNDNTVELISTSHCKQMKSIRRGTENKKRLAYLLKCFLKWYYQAIIYNKQFLNDFILHLNKAIVNLNHILALYHLQKPFNKIIKSEVNMSNAKILRLKKIIYSNDKKILFEAWIRLKQIVFHKKIIQLKGKTINRTYYFSNQISKFQILSKRFLYWKLSKTYTKLLFKVSASSLSHFIKVLIRFQLKIGINNIINNCQWRKKCKAFMIIFQTIELKNKKWLKNILNRWSKRRKLILYNILQIQEFLLIRRAFKQFKKWLIQSRKNIIQIKQGIQIINPIILKAKQLPWNLLYNHFSINHLAKILTQNVSKHLKLFYNRKILQCFNQWLLKSKNLQHQDYQIKNSLNIQLRRRKKIEDKRFKKYILKWYNICQYFKSSIYGVSLYSALINKQDYLVKLILFRNIVIRPYLNIWKQKIVLLSLNQKKQILIKKLIIPKLRKVSLNNLKRDFENWRRLNHQSELKQFKRKYLPLLIFRKEKENNIKSIFKYFKNWKYRGLLSHSTKLGNANLLISSIKNPLNRQHLKGMKQGLLNQLKNQKLTSLLQSNISQYYTRWRNRIKNIQKYTKDMKSFVIFVMSNNTIKKKINQTFIASLSLVFSEIFTLIKKQSQVIKEYTQGIVIIKNQMNILKRNITLRAKLDSLILRNKIKLELYFNVFKRHLIQMRVNNKARTIQTFYRKKLKSNNLLHIKLINPKIEHNTLLEHNSVLLLKNSIDKERQSKMNSLIDNQKFTHATQSLLYYYNKWKIQKGLLNKEDSNVIYTKSTSLKCSNNSIKSHDWLKQKVLFLSLQNKLMFRSMIVKWRKVNYYVALTKSSLTIQKCFRNNATYSKRIKQQFNQKNIKLDYLTKLITKNSWIKNKIIKCKFRKWAKNTRILVCNNYATLIQQFVSSKISRLAYIRLKNNVMQMSRFTLFKKLHLLGTINKCYLAIQKHLLNQVFQRLKQLIYQLKTKIILPNLNINPINKKNYARQDLNSFVNLLNSYIMQNKKYLLYFLKNNVVKLHFDNLHNINTNKVKVNMNTYFTKWKNNGLGIHSKKRKSIHQLILNIINKRYLITHYYLIAWRKKIQKMHFIAQALIIQSFLLKSKKHQTAMHSWNSLVTAYNRWINKNMILQNCKNMIMLIAFDKINQLNQIRLITRFERWKNKMPFILHHKHLFNLLFQFSKEVKKQNKNLVTKTIYRLYTYKILSQIINRLNEKMFNLQAHCFLIQLIKYSNLSLSSSFNKTRSGIHSMPPINLQFKSIHSRRKILANNHCTSFIIMPFFTQFLVSLINKAKNNYFEVIKTNSLSQNPNQKYENMSYYSTKNGSKLLINAEIGEKMKLEEQRQLDLLISITMKHKARILMKNIKHILARWHVYTELLKNKRMQLKIMQNNEKDTYDILADQLFGQGSNPNQNVLKELKALYNQMHY